ncbi:MULTISPECIES: aspartate 1-decarboxylase [Synechocystis]|uniref:Aspartate 1-decarboxylase n=1 Tax=Synechocystis salina LEGE 00031 TaxID=1828736 RepID=A0ABR9VSI8_9SYNC|nr:MULTISPECIES: aspartate 1-decarboxylase [Synechocystis]MBD2654819.1 aspartate 1-decarboxylase [Synechocystis sp. FACHB-383]MBE9196644.1 aspartate 1-decarboxylase [Synechocystis sp. LEGE 06083]MBE9240594.1 aspartate 1-decarboxylase [Synechocystis salina LEGE 00041]MBE9254006.1 aspartate 1-decarboxylase [Synechocystis salina LEGE 00031]
MGSIRLMHAKLHRVCVTEANVNYVGSITIDPVMLERVGLLPLEEVDIINLSNGNRFSTYVLPGQAHSKEICPNGGAALLCQPGDRLIIFAYELCERNQVLRTGHQAKVLVANESNETVDFYLQELIPQEQGVQFINTNCSAPVPK